MTRPARVILPGALRTLFPGAPFETEVRPGTVATLLDELDGRWPGMADRLRDSRPAIRKHINIFVDGSRATLETEVPEGAEVYVLTAISGG